MDRIYRVVVRGKTIESRDVRKLLARAVAEKRALDLRFRLRLGDCLARTGAAMTQPGLESAGQLT
ncbi:MAG: hypothetical protein FJW35_10590 [Acidobacteria bacterium]|nr:hypothetical protein [Acidobacteriota bacterium]